MAPFTQPKIQEASTSTLGNLLATLKSSVNVSGSSSNLFASLLSETSASVPVVEPQEPTAMLSTRTAATKSSAPEWSSSQNVRDDAPPPAAERNENTKNVADNDARAPHRAEPALDNAAERAEAKAEPKSKAEPKEEKEVSDDPEAASDEAAQAVATSEQDAETESAEAPLDEQLAALLLMLGAAEEAPAPVAEVAVKTEEIVVQAAPDQEENGPLDEQLFANVIPFGERPAQKTKMHEDEANKDKSLQTEVATPAAMDQTLDQLAAQSAETADTLLAMPSDEAETPEAASEYAKMVEEASAAKVGETQTTENGNRRDQADLLKGQERAAANNTAQRSGTVTTTQTTATTSSGAASELGVQAAGGASSSQGTTPLATGVRPMGSYDFASQLSAARVTKGGSAGLPQAVEQVAVQLHKAAKEGADEITIQLRPAELGKIEIKLEFAADKSVTGTVIADNQATLNMLQKDSASLQRALQEAGLQADAGCMEFSLRDDNQTKQFAQEQNGNNGRRTGFNLAGIGDEADALGDLATAAETYYLTPGRVNLRV